MSLLPSVMSFFSDTGGFIFSAHLTGVSLMRKAPARADAPKTTVDQYYLGFKSNVEKSQKKGGVPMKNWTKKIASKEKT